MRDSLEWMIDQIRATEKIRGWGNEMDAKLVLIRRDPVLFAEAARIIEREKIDALTKEYQAWDRMYKAWNQEWRKIRNVLKKDARKLSRIFTGTDTLSRP